MFVWYVQTLDQENFSKPRIVVSKFRNIIFHFSLSPIQLPSHRRSRRLFAWLVAWQMTLPPPSSLLPSWMTNEARSCSWVATKQESKHVCFPCTCMHGRRKRFEISGKPFVSAIFLPCRKIVFFGRMISTELFEERWPHIRTVHFCGKIYHFLPQIRYV